MKSINLIRSFLNPLIYVILYSIHLLSDWIVIKFSNHRAPELGDLRFVLEGYLLCNRGASLELRDAMSVVITNVCPEYVYGRALFFVTWLLGEFSDLESSLQEISIMLGLTLAITLGFLFSTDLIGRGARPWLVILASFSPAMVFLYERTNFDLIMALIVILAAYLISKNRPIMGLFVIFMSAVFKFYTLPLLWLLVVFFKSPRVKIMSLVFASIATIVVIQDVQRMNPLVPAPGTYQFGFSVFEHYFYEVGLSNWSSSVPFIGFVLPLVVSLVLTLRKTRLPAFSILEKNGARLSSKELILVMSSVTFLACYFTGLSYDYRLIFLLLAGVLYIDGGKFTRSQEWGLWVMLLGALWGSTAFGLGLAKEVGEGWVYVVGIGQLLGDVSVLVWTVLLLTSLALGLVSLLEGRGKKLNSKLPRPSV
jgi:hypothetical protein